MEKLPYPQLILLQNKQDTYPNYHYTELVSYIKKNPPKQSVYIHSGSIYSILLIAASSSEDVTIVIAHDFSDKNLVKSSFDINKLSDKFII